MRRQRLLRPSSTQSLCIICACRFLGHELRRPLVAAPSRRYLNTTRPPRQSAAAAPAQPHANGNGNVLPQQTQWSGFDPTSSLTPAEQAEKERRRRLRLQAEQEQERRRIDEMQRREEAMRTMNRQTEGERERRRIGDTQREEEARRQAAERHTFQQRQPARNGNGNGGLRIRKRGVERSQMAERVAAALEGRGKHTPRSAAHAQQNGPVRRVPQKQKIAVPSFGGGPAQPSETVAGGWGTGSVETKPLQYADGDEADSSEQHPPREPRNFDQSESVDPSPSSDNYRDNATWTPLRYTRPSAQEPFDYDERSRSELHSNDRRKSYDQNYQNDYRATPFDPAEYQPSRYNEQQGDTWQHLPRRKSAPSPPPSSQKFQNYAQQQSNYFEDAEFVDRQFEEHKRKRDAQLQSRYPPPPPERFKRASAPEPAYSNPNIQNAGTPFNHEFSSGPARESRCARCLQPGHTARNCTGPIKGKCNNCGEVGHLSRYCPLKKGVVRRQNSRAPTDQTSLPKQRFAAATFESKRSEDFSRRPWQAREPESRDEKENARVEEPQFHGTPAPSWQRAVTGVDEETTQRRARRSRRGFEDDGSADVEEDYEIKGRRSNRKRFERPPDADDEEADEAGALREERAARKAARKAAREAARRDQPTTIHLPDFVSVSNLAQALGVHYDPFVKRLQELGYGDDVFPGKVLDKEISGMIAMEYNIEPIFESSTGAAGEEEERDLKARPDVDDKTYLATRPPVVTIMGHVDHGKTTLLDFLRKSSVAAGEAGGITQHIGAFSVPMSSSGRTITFLDTPGHAAFLSMRQRGANVTDIVILVVAADDSVKPQTLESIRCANEAGVPMIVAVNKVDKEEADVQRVKQDLARNGVEIEDFGGETQVVCVSGKTGQGMEELEEAVVTLSEILDHRSDVMGEVEGWVLEATTKRAGRVATVLVNRGTLRPGAVVVAGKTWARVRTLRNEAGHTVHEAGPGMPVEVDGWKDQPNAGDEVLQAPSEQKATSVVEYRLEKEERLKTAEDMEAINEARRLEQERRAKEKAAENGDVPPTATTEVSSPAPEETGQITVPFLIKSDVSGSAEAVAAYIPSLTSPLITPLILSSTVGQIHESDIELASAANGHIIAFNLPKNEEMRGLAESRGVKVLENNVIYRVLDDVKAVLEERLPMLFSQRVLGEAEVSTGFEIGVGGRRKIKIAGCKVRNGVIGKNARVRMLRGHEKVYDGTINSLKNVKKDVQEMRKGTECGMGFDDWEGFEVGDLVQTYEEIGEKRKL